MNVLFPALRDASTAPALRFGDRALSYRQLAAVAGPLAERIGAETRVAIWATATLETSVGVISALLAGVPAVPVNPKIGESELAHIVADSAPSLVLAQSRRRPAGRARRPPAPRRRGHRTSRGRRSGTVPVRTG